MINFTAPYVHAVSQPNEPKKKYKHVLLTNRISRRAKELSNPCSLRREDLEEGR
jgi:hypothetical protein